MKYLKTVREQDFHHEPLNLERVVTGPVTVSGHTDDRGPVSGNRTRAPIITGMAPVQEWRLPDWPGPGSSEVFAASDTILDGLREFLDAAVAAGVIERS
jgi:hypothetical protein